MTVATRPTWLTPLLSGLLILACYRSLATRPPYNEYRPPAPVLAELIPPISEWRAGFSGLLQATASPAEQPILRALILGDRRGIPRAQMDQLYRLGVGHLLAISGLHIGLVAFGALAIAKLVTKSRTAHSAFALAPAALYASIVPLRHSTARAFIMLTVYLILRATGRTRERRQGIILAAVVILIAQPSALFNAGFQLSFAAVISLSLFLPPLLRWAKPATRAGSYILTMIGAACICTVALAPILLWHFGQAPVVGVLANPLIIPLITAVVGLLLAAFLIYPLSVAASGGLIIAASWPVRGAEALFEALSTILKTP